MEKTVVAGDLHIQETVVYPKIATALYGAIQQGFLSVRGRLKAAEWKKGTESILQRAFCDQLRMPGTSSRDGFLTLRVYSDAYEIDSFGIEWSLVFLLMVLGPREKSDGHYSGLVLRKEKSAEPDVYSRVGVFKFILSYDDYHNGRHPLSEKEWRSRFQFQSSWSDDCEPETITFM
jgi:hypothetical protein